MWPYSTTDCSNGNEKLDWTELNPQKISACPDPQGFNRTKYDMASGVGRGAPEFDVFEIRCVSGSARASVCVCVEGTGQ
jgi:hypothetical protein